MKLLSTNMRIRVALSTSSFINTDTYVAIDWDITKDGWSKE